MNEHTIKLTAHPTTAKQQLKKIQEEFKEVKKAFKKNMPDSLIDECIDLATASLKLANHVCEMSQNCLDHKIKENIMKNDERGYYDVSTFIEK